MNNSSLLLIAYFVVLGQTLAAQTIEILADNLNTSMRGLSVVNDRVVWASGSKGTVGVTTDGGKTWSWQTVKGFETRDFRDIEAFDERTAVIIGIAEPAVILRTTDAGVNWKVVYENKTPGMFLDAMDFVDDQHGTVVGDPVNGRFFIAHTQDGGLTWKEAPAESLPEADSGEACFAASGTNLRLTGNGTSYLVSGGKRSRLFVNGKSQELPLLQGKQSTGANSFAYYTDKKSKTTTWIVTGGDFSADTLRAGNCVISHDQGKTWKTPATPPAGYRSCVEFISATSLIASGTSGVDVSADGGMTWKKISPAGYHVCRKAKKGTAVFLAGKGRIARLINP
jgi:photosystem II stability/assembly factor-like uncharacterized protein